MNPEGTGATIRQVASTKDACQIYLQVRPEDIAYIQAVFESYEGVGIVRTVDRKKAIIVLVVVSDFLEVARAILASLEQEIPLSEIPRPPEIGEDWLLRELAAGDDLKIED